MLPRILIIAYGNPLRCDDGIAWRAAEALEGKFRPDQVEILRVHQLAPELAESISRSQFVVFLDATTLGSDRTKPGEIRIEQIQRKEENQPSGFCHALSPTNVLALSERLYGASPLAYFLSMIGENFNHGESLSATVAKSLPDFIARAEGLIRECLHKSTNP
jgi:hydrogenase maturation protease